MVQQITCLVPALKRKSCQLSLKQMFEHKQAESKLVKRRREDVRRVSSTDIMICSVHKNIIIIKVMVMVMHLHR